MMKFTGFAIVVFAVLFGIGQATAGDSTHIHAKSGDGSGKLTVSQGKKQPSAVVVNLPDETGVRDISLHQVQVALKQASLSHPRLFLNDKQLTGVMRDIQSSDELKVLHEEFLRRADGLTKQKPLKRIKTGKRLLSVSRDALKRLLILGWAYRTSRQEKYLKRAEQEMLAIADFSDWNPSHFLDVAEMTTAMAIGYDWLYNDLSDQSRTIIRNAIVKKGIRPSLYENKKPGWWISSNNNWNQVCHGGITCGVLAIMEDEPGLAETIVHRSVNKVQIAMKEYEPNGAYPEGPSYWVYGTTYNVLLLAALDSVLGTDFGLSKKGGFVKSAEYYLHATGPTGLYFNYPDCGSKGDLVPAVFWFAEKYKNSALIWNQQKLWQKAIQKGKSDLARNRTAVLALAWASSKAAKPQRLSWMGQGVNPVAMFRTSWNDDAVYLAIKGGTPSSNHAHMDIGSFVIDAEGVRWALDLGAENYNKIESLGLNLWNSKQTSDRWKIFRYSNFSHNTLTVNDQLQCAKGFAPIIQYSDDSKFPHVAIDMTKVYEGQLKKALRGALLLPSGQILIQDELQATDKPATVRWAMVTPAKVEIQSDKAAILTQKQKTMQFNVVTDADVKLTTYSTKPRADYDAGNGNTRMIGFEVKLAPNEKVTIAVIMTSGLRQAPTSMPLKNIQSWSKPLEIAREN